MGKKRKKAQIGDDSVVIGNVSQSVGSRSVVIGPTDARGNTVLNSPMAVGHGATADASSIAIGAGASAGDTREILLAQLAKAVVGSPDPELRRLVDEFTNEARSSEPSNSRLRSLWVRLKSAGAFAGVVDLGERLLQLISVLGSS